MFNKVEQKIIDHAIEGINELIKYEVEIEGSELHNKLFNEDYFIIGTYNAEMFLRDCGGAFACIAEVKDYEEGNFGSVTTNLGSAESVANMYAYIRGEEILGKCATLRDNWDKRLDKEQLEAIIEELNEI
jgi:hypothetical protein